MSGEEQSTDEVPERMTDEERVLWSESIPGHLWDAVKRWCQCGAEVGVRCDRQTVEQHLLEVDPNYALALDGPR